MKRLVAGLLIAASICGSALAGPLSLLGAGRVSGSSVPVSVVGYGTFTSSGSTGSNTYTGVITTTGVQAGDVIIVDGVTGADTTTTLKFPAQGSDATYFARGYNTAGGYNHLLWTYTLTSGDLTAGVITNFVINQPTSTGSPYEWHIFRRSTTSPTVTNFSYAQTALGATSITWSAYTPISDGVSGAAIFTVQGGTPTSTTVVCTPGSWTTANNAAPSGYWKHYSFYATAAYSSASITCSNYTSTTQSLSGFLVGFK